MAGEITSYVISDASEFVTTYKNKRRKYTAAATAEQSVGTWGKVSNIYGCELPGLTVAVVILWTAKVTQLTDSLRFYL